MGIERNILQSLEVESRPTLEEILNRNLSSVLIGIELEYLIFRDDRPATLQDYRKILDSLKARWKVAEEVSNGEVSTLLYPISDELKIEVKPDFSYNVLEISIGKGTHHDLKLVLQDLLSDLIDTIKQAGLTIHSESFKKCKLQELSLANWPHLKGYLDQFPAEEKPFGSAWYPAEIAAAQIHLDILSSDYFEFAVYLYLQEFIFLKDFTQTQTRDGMSARFKSYEEGLGVNYLAKTIPAAIYRNSNEFCEMLQSSPQLFKSDPLNAVKDLSYIRPRTYGSVEFRSACTSLDLKTIDTLIIARLSQLICAVQLKKSIISRRSDIHLLPRKFWLIQSGDLPLTEDVRSLMNFIESNHRSIVVSVKNDLLYKKSRRRLSRSAA